MKLREEDKVMAQLGRPKMEEIWMNTACLLSLRSTCLRLKVGCVVTSEDLSQVYSCGYNGNYRGGPNRCDTREPGNCGCIHAEVNALVKIRVDDQKKIVFTTTLPCKQCAKLMVNSGVSQVYYKKSYRNDLSINVFKKSKIKIIKL